MAQNENKDSKPLYIGSKILNLFKYAFLILCCLVVIVPILVVLIGSLKTYKELSNTTVFTLPEVPQWENFKTAFFTQNILLAFKNTAIILRWLYHNRHDDGLCRSAFQHLFFKDSKDSVSYCNASA